jgi:tetratricopeptide (TPR) repeat protein
MKNVFVALLIVAFAVPSFSQTKSPRAEAYLHFSKARLAAEAGQLNEAIAEYKKALEFDPNNSDIYSEMADTYLRGQRVRDALDSAQKAVKANANNGDAHKILASIYTSMIGDNNQPVTEDTVNAAIHEFEEIVRIDPSDRQSYLMLGRLYQVKNDDKKAEEIYRKFLGVEPESEEAITALARLHTDANNVKEAIRILEEFVSHHPEADRALEELAQAYANAEQFDKAVATYRKALAMAPDDVDLKKSLAQALFLDEKFDEAATLYQELLKLDANDGLALLRLGQIYREQKRYAQAHVYMLQAIKNFPDSMEVQFNMMLLEKEEGMLAEANQRVTDILKRTERANGRYSESEKQNRRMFLRHSAQMSDLLGKYDDEIKALEDLKAITPNTGGIIDKSIVDAHRSAKNLDKAIAYSDQALKESPDSLPLKLTRADMIAEKGRVDEAIRSLKDLMKGGEQDMDVLSTMANIYIRAKKFDEAGTIAETLVKQFPQDLNAWFQQGSIYERQKKYGEAEKAFRKALELDSDNPAVLNYLGYMLADRNMKLDEAVTMIEKAVNSDPTNGAYLDSLGWAYFRQNKLQLAEEYLKKALRFAANDSTVNDHMGDLFFKTQRFEEAKTAWTKVLQVSTDPEEIARTKKKIDDLKGKVAKP